MIISSLMLLLLLGGIFAWFLDSKFDNSARWIALAATSSSLLFFIVFLANSELNFAQLNTLQRVSWISFLNIEYAIGIDYLSVLMILLTLALSIICVLVSWQEIQDKRGFYYFNLLASIAGIIGVFSAVDLFLFFFFGKSCYCQ